MAEPPEGFWEMTTRKGTVKMSEDQAKILTMIAEIKPQQWKAFLPVMKEISSVLMQGTTGSMIQSLIEPFMTMIDATLASALAPIMEAIAPLIPAIMEIIKPILETLEEPLKNMAAIVSATLGWMKDSGVFNFLIKAIDLIISWTAPMALLPKILDIIKKVWDFLTGGGGADMNIGESIFRSIFRPRLPPGPEEDDYIFL